MKKQNIHAAAVLIALSLILCCCFTAYAVDLDYTGPLDPETNQPLGGEVVSSFNREMLSTGMFYDWSTHDYVYPVEDSLLEVHMNVADGMIVNTPVYVGSDDPSVLIYCSGSEVTGDRSNIRKPGDYMVSVKNGGSLVRLMDFRIVGDSTNAINRFEAPDGFYILSASRDGENIYQGRYTVEMEEEGYYDIEYLCGATDHSYRLQVAIDRTPPQVNFQAKLDKEGRVRSAVSYSGLESTDTVVLLRDGTAVDAYVNSDGTGQILDPGNYIMRVYDAAGNMSEYQFTVMVYLNAGSWIFIILLLAVIIAVGAYVVFKRKNLKIG